MNELFKKADIVLAAVLLILGAGGLFLPSALGSGGSTAVVRVDGKVYGSYSLSEDRIVDVETGYGRNTVVIEGGSVRVSEADCPGGDCTRFAPVSGGGSVILCLPHHLSVTVEGADGPDAVIR
ncbi:MAG: NusG domain II-containing protein [Firmicutes bacterium]|nr:NusG domain II-containing protein [Bacillota bacterium]